METSSKPAAGIGLAAALYLRIALATAFLSAVADRFGLWGGYGDPGVAWGDMEHFLAYAGSLLPWVPPAWIPLVGWTATTAEIVLGTMLLLGYRIRAVAAGSGVLLLTFAFGMIVGDGPKAPLDASVFTASAGAFLLFVHPHSYMSLDGRRS